MIAFVDDSYYFQAWVSKNYPKARFFFSEIELIEYIKKNSGVLNLVFMDQLIDGYDALDDILPTLYPDIKFVLLTANKLLPSEKQELSNAGYLGYISKLDHHPESKINKWIRKQ